MRLLVSICLILLSLASQAAASNTHGSPDIYKEMGSWFYDQSAEEQVITGCAPVTGSSLTVAAFACAGYVDSGAQKIYVSQSATNLTVSGNGTWWLALHKDSTTVVGGWSRKAGSHYLFATSSTQPSDPDSGFVFAQVTASGGNITSVNTAAFIQGKITAAAAGQTVTVGPGTWTIGAPGLLMDDKTDFVLRCHPTATLKVNQTPTLTIGDFGATAVVMRHCTRCMIQGCHFDGNGANVTAQTLGVETSFDSEIRGNSFVNGGKLGSVMAAGNTGNRYVANTVHDGVSPARGMWLGNCTNVNYLEINALVAQNTVYSMPASGIGGAFVRSRISENISHDNAGSGIVFASCTVSSLDLSIVGNTTYNNVFFGIQSDSVSPARSARVTIAGNVTRANVESGIYMALINEATVSGNVVIDNTVDGIVVNQAARISILGNTILNTGEVGLPVTRHGINVDIQSANMTDVIIANNLIFGMSARGIDVESVAASTLNGLVITGNIARDNGTFGLVVVPASANKIENVVVRGNVFQGNTTDIRLGTNATTPFAALIADGNVFDTSDGQSSTGLSKGAVIPQNLSGACTFANGVGTCDVTFGNTEPDANYIVAVTCNVGKIAWVTMKATTGFRISESAAGTGTDACDWVLTR